MSSGQKGCLNTHILSPRPKNVCKILRQKAGRVALTSSLQVPLSYYSRCSLVITTSCKSDLGRSKSAVTFQWQEPRVVKLFQRKPHEVNKISLPRADQPRSEILFSPSPAQTCRRPKAITEASEGEGDGEQGFETSGPITLNNVIKTCYFESALQLKTVPRTQPHFTLIVIPSALCMNLKSSKSPCIDFLVTSRAQGNSLTTFPSKSTHAHPNASCSTKLMPIGLARCSRFSPEGQTYLGLVCDSPGRGPRSTKNSSGRQRGSLSKLLGSD